MFMARYRPGDPDFEHLRRLFTITNVSAPEYSHWCLRRHTRPELHSSWVRTCQLLGLDGDGLERCAATKEADVKQKQGLAPH